MELRGGYKQTELGVIPKDWSICSIQGLINEKIIIDHLDGNHGELYPRSHEFKQYGVPYIAANNLVNGRVDFSGCKFLSENRASRFRKGIAKDGDVLFAHNATVGPVGLLRTELDYVILSTTATYFRCDQEKLLNSYLLYCLQSPLFVRQYSAVMSQSTRNQVPITAQRKFKIVLPPTKPEQTAIASALSDADTLIQSLSRLIAKKCQIKQGAMQTLLNPYENGRLKEGWVVKKLGEVALDIASGTSKTQSNGEDYPIFGSTGVIGRSDNYDYEGSRILIARVGANAGTVNRVSGKYLVSDNTLMMTLDKDISINYIFYYLKNSNLKGLVFGSGQPLITGGQLKNLDCPIPISGNEQTHIATILSDMDAEIEVLKTKLTKYQKIKQGMMQNLLTGKIRLLNSEERKHAVA